MKHELAIAHRVCAAASKNAAGFPDKFEMVKRNARSLFDALRGIRTRLFVLLDGCPDEYERFFRDLAKDFPDIEMDVERADHAGNHATFAWQLSVLADRTDAPFVYLSEDDYIYRPGAFRAMLEVLRQPWADFVTPLDHPDRYNRSTVEPARTELRVAGDCHWRRAPTTCLTFLAKREAFLGSLARLRAYSDGAEDSVVWLGITKEGLFSPSVLSRSVAALFRRVLLRRSVWYGHMLPLMAWAKHNVRLFFTPRFSLWSPVPSLAVHCCSTSVPPDCGWILGQIPEADVAALLAAGEKYLREGRDSPIGD